MRLIDADALLLDNTWEWYDEYGNMTQAGKAIHEAPTIDPVKQGHWLYTEAYPHRVYCSVCYRTYALQHWQVWEDGSLARAYCPNCGAKMDGEKAGDAE